MAGGRQERKHGCDQKQRGYIASKMPELVSVIDGLRGHDAGKALSRILEIKPNFSAHLELRKWNASPDDLDHIVEGLRKAGWSG